MNEEKKTWSTVCQQQKPETEKRHGLGLEELEHEYDVKFRALVQAPFQPIGAAYIENGCCRNRPVLITANKRTNGTLNYSCQCACGLWCTTGCDTASEALQHYERMTAGENLYGGFRKFTY